MPESQANSWGSCHSGIYHKIHRHSETGNVQILERNNDKLQRLSYSEYSPLISLIALYSKQRTQAVWNLCINCWLWLRWNPKAVSDRPIRDLPRLEGQCFFFVCFFKYLYFHHSVLFTCLTNKVLVWKQFPLILLYNFVEKYLGKCNRPQRENSEGVFGEELHRWSHRWGQWGHQVGYQSLAGGKVILNLCISLFY